MKEYCALHIVPIYGTKLEFVVSDSITKARNKPDRVKRYRSKYEEGEFYGLLSRFGNYMGLFIASDAVTHDGIAHEVFHLTHRIAEFVEVKFDPDHHEALAYLNQELTRTIYDDLKKWKIKIK